MAVGRDTKNILPRRLAAGKESREEVPASNLAYAKTEIYPLMGKRVEVYALEKDVDELIAHMRRAAKEGQKEQFVSLRDAAFAKLDQIRILRDAFDERDPEWKEIGRYWQVARGIVNQIEQEQGKKAGGGTEARTGVHSAAAIRKEPKRRVVDIGRSIAPWEEPLFQEYPELRKALAGDFNIPKQEWIKSSAVREPAPPRSTIESFAVSPDKGLETKLSVPIRKLQKLFAQWFQEKGVSMAAYERQKYDDPWAEEDIRFDPKIIELTGSVMILYERLKAIRDALRDEAAGQVSYVVGLLATQLQGMRTEGKTEEALVRTAQELVVDIHTIISEKEKSLRKPAAPREERASA